MRTVVLAFLRSGTRSMAKILNLGHENENENGTSDWRLAFTEFECDKLIHVIRNPIDVISSNIFTMGLSSLQIIKQMADIEDKSLLSNIIEGFIKWTNAIEKLKPDEILRIEEKEIRVNARAHPTLKWEDLKGVPVELQNQIKEIAIKYGYDPND